MSRVVVFGLDNHSVGEFFGTANRGYTLSGSYSISGGGQTSIAVPDSVVSQEWLQFGRMVMISHATLPPYAGMLDTPWKATLPGSLSIYNLEYLLSIRVPESPVTITGSVFEIVARVLELANAPEELYLRLGTTSGNSLTRTETVTERTLWEQLNQIVARAGLEMNLRPALEGGQLVIYVDVMERIGLDTGLILHDGDNANMQIVDAVVDGKIINRLTGLGSQSTAASRITTGLQGTPASRRKFRLRSDVMQFQVSDGPTLLASTMSALAASSWPKLIMRINIADVGDAFKLTAPGNTCQLHASRLYLPGGVRAWRGDVRIMSMAYDESNNTVGATVEAPFYGE